MNIIINALNNWSFKPGDIIPNNLINFHKPINKEITLSLGKEITQISGTVDLCSIKGKSYQIFGQEYFLAGDEIQAVLNYQNIIPLLRPIKGQELEVVRKLNRFTRKISGEDLWDWPIILIK